MPSQRQPWFDDDAGPLVRPYTLTGGRTKQSRHVDIITMVVASGTHLPRQLVEPEPVRIHELCATPLSVVEIAAELRLPVLVTKILVGDLVEQGHLTLCAPNRSTVTGTTDVGLLQAVLQGIRNA